MLRAGEYAAAELPGMPTVNDDTVPRRYLEEELRRLLRHRQAEALGGAAE
jgi:hypothetical protein